MNTKAKTTSRISAALARAAATTASLPPSSDIDSRMRAADALISASTIATGDDMRRTGGGNTEYSKRFAVPLARCKPHPFNARKFYPPASEQEFALVIASEGQMDAAKALPDPDQAGHWLIVDGVRRLRVLRRNGAETIDITPLDPSLTPFQIYKLSKSLNDARAEQTDLDNAFSWKALIESNIVTDQTDLAEQLGMSKSTVSRIVSLAELPEPLLEVMRLAPEKFPYRLANELRLLAREKNIDVAVSQATVLINDEDETVTVRSLEAIRLRPTETPASKRTRENPSSTTRLAVGGAVTGALKVFPSGRLLLDIAGVNQTLQNRLQAAIQQVLNEAT